MEYIYMRIKIRQKKDSYPSSSYWKEYTYGTPIHVYAPRMKVIQTWVFRRCTLPFILAEFRIPQSAFRKIHRPQRATPLYQEDRSKRITLSDLLTQKTNSNDVIVFNCVPNCCKLSTSNMAGAMKQKDYNINN